jgi:hypothetical protein
MLMALAAGARAEDSIPAPPPPAAVDPFPAPAPAGTVGTVVVVAPAEPPPKRLEIGLSFLPMGRGRLTTPRGAVDAKSDALFAYGASLQASYRIIAGLHLGLAPQVIYNVNYKTNPAGNGIALPPAAKQYDLMARVAYEFPIVDGIVLYAEALPGYSYITVPGASAAKGFVVALGGGATMDMSDRIFVNVGAGYQVGYQSFKVVGMARDYRTEYVRVAMGVGARF